MASASKTSCNVSKWILSVVSPISKHSSIWLSATKEWTQHLPIVTCPRCLHWPTPTERPTGCIRSRDKATSARLILPRKCTRFSRNLSTATCFRETRATIRHCRSSMPGPSKHPLSLTCLGLVEVFRELWTIPISARHLDMECKQRPPPSFGYADFHSLWLVLKTYPPFNQFRLQGLTFITHLNLPKSILLLHLHFDLLFTCSSNHALSFSIIPRPALYFANGIFSRPFVFMLSCDQYFLFVIHICKGYSLLLLL